MTGIMAPVLKFSSELRNLSLAEQLVDKISTKHKISHDLYGNILISLTEAVNNAIVHGNRLDNSKMVEIIYSCNKKTLVLCVKDEGNGFNFNVLPDPTSPENIEKLDGRGIYLIKNLADNVEFSQNGTQIEMKFNLNS